MFAFPHRISVPLLLLLSACTAQLGDLDSDCDEVECRQSIVQNNRRAEYAANIRDTAAGQGMTNGVLLAGIGEVETNLTHCWSEATWACQGPASPTCGGGPVIAGASDGPCSAQQGGLGMFQFDSGTYQQTLARYGEDVVSLEGNVSEVVPFLVTRAIESVPGIGSEQQALDWMNSIPIVDGDPDFEEWLAFISWRYNGCRGCTFQANKYRAGTHRLQREMGAAFWSATDGGTGTSPAIPMEAYWNRDADGTYQLRALGAASITRVEYYVDGFQIGEASRVDGQNFPDSYQFQSQGSQRHFEVRGFDANDQQIGRGIGLLDVTDGTALYIRQMGPALYEIGLERAPTAVAAIEVRADGYLLSDVVSSDVHSSRKAVRSSFNQLGMRNFDLTTFNADGSVRGTLRRSFTLQ
jgi:hypothetical protein